MRTILAFLFAAVLLSSCAATRTVSPAVARARAQHMFSGSGYNRLAAMAAKDTTAVSFTPDTVSSRAVNKR